MLNKQGPNKIDYLNYVWNPVKGRCLRNCPYCYMQRYYQRFKLDETIRLDEKTLNCKFPNERSRIGICFNHDLFGKWISSEWIYQIIKRIEETPQHIFLFLTKEPKRYNEFKFPMNCWLGTTVDGTGGTIENLYILANMPLENLKFISLEPLLEIENLKKVPLDIFKKIDWFILGADSNPGAKQPPLIWADMFRKLCARLGVPLWIKDNYHFVIKIKEEPKLWNKENKE